MKNLGERRCVEEIRGRILTLHHDDKAVWGVMNAGEMVCHLREAYRVAGTVPNVALIPGPVSPGMMKFFALKLPMKWPKTIQTVPELKRESLPAPGEFEAEKKRLLEEFEGFVVAAAKRLSHPFFGTMTAWDWQRWGYLHGDHHLRQFGR